MILLKIPQMSIHPICDLVDTLTPNFINTCQVCIVQNLVEQDTILCENVLNAVNYVAVSMLRMDFRQISVEVLKEDNYTYIKLYMHDEKKKKKK